jgi:methylmalonyl-CoA mutase cobalamin-binding domain/chain
MAAPDTTARQTTGGGEQLRIVLAKLGLDGHDRGLRVVTRMLRDAGFEVVYLGLRQTVEMVVAAAIQEDADAVGISLHNASHMTLAPRMVEALRDAEVDIPVILGGIIPDDDVRPLRDAGVAAILGPGASSDDVATAVCRAVAEGAAS